MNRRKKALIALILSSLIGIGQSLLPLFVPADSDTASEARNER